MAWRTFCFEVLPVSLVNDSCLKGKASYFISSNFIPTFGFESGSSGILCSFCVVFDQWFFGSLEPHFSKRQISFCRYSTTLIDRFALSCHESPLLGSTESLGFASIVSKTTILFLPQKWKIAGLAFLKKPASPNFFKKLAKSHWLLMPYLSLVRYFFVKKCFWTKTVILFLGRVLGFTAVVFSEIHGWSGILSLFSSNLRGLFKRLSTLFSLLAIIYCHWTDFSAVELARFRVEIEIIFSEATENTKNVQV